MKNKKFVRDYSNRNCSTCNLGTNDLFCSDLTYNEEKEFN